MSNDTFFKNLLRTVYKYFIKFHPDWIARFLEISGQKQPKVTLKLLLSKKRIEESNILFI